MDTFKRLLPLLIFMLASCGNPPSDVSNLPTLAQLPTLTDTPPITETPTPSATLTLTPTATPSVTGTSTITPTVTPSITDTNTPTATSTPLPTADNQAVSLLAQLAAQATVLPPGFLNTPPAAAPTGSLSLPTSCPYQPPGGFGTIFANDTLLIQQIGCPIGVPPAPFTTNSAVQTFERGSMAWLQGPPNVIYVLFSDGRFQRFDDTWNPSIDPEGGNETPPAGLISPVRGFGKVWRQDATVRSNLGWATGLESGSTATVLAFDRGRLVFLPQRNDTIALIDDPGGSTGLWRAFAGGP